MKEPLRGIRLSPCDFDLIPKMKEPPKEGLLVLCVTTHGDSTLGGHEYLRRRDVARTLPCYPTPYIWYKSYILHPVCKLPLLLFVCNCSSVDQTFRGPHQTKTYRVKVRWRWWPCHKSFETTTYQTSGAFCIYPIITRLNYARTLLCRNYTLCEYWNILLCDIPSNKLGVRRLSICTTVIIKRESCFKRMLTFTLKQILHVNFNVTIHKNI